MMAFKDNRPAAVILSVDVDQETPAELENLRVVTTARERLANFDETQAVSHAAMRARYANQDC